MFQKYLEDIKHLDYDILDVKKTKWHDDYGQKFKENQKSLEIMYRNTALHAFKNITTVAEGVEMLENFHQLAKRQLVKDYINTKAAENVYNIFMNEMKEVEEMYENYTKAHPPMPPSLPKYSGLAIWALSLMIRIDSAKKEIDTLFFIEDHPSKIEALEKYRKLKDALDSFITKTQFEDNWNKEILEKLDINKIDDKLKTPLLVRSENVKTGLPDAVKNNPIFTKAKDGEMLESNFDKTLLKTLSEGTFWTKLQALGMVTVNHSVTKLLAQKEQLRTMRENVMIIVREYNKIIASINPEQKKLFKEHLNDLDKVIESGMTRFKWNSQANSFLLNSRTKCIEIFNKVKKFQKNEKIMKRECDNMGRTTLTDIGKDLYNLNQFLTEQEQTLKNNERKFINAFIKIGNFMLETYEIFIFQKEDIQNEFMIYVEQFDKKILSALKGAVKNTLLDLSKHIRGENKKSEDTQAFVPIFRVYTLINPKEANLTVIHEPSAEDLREGIEKLITKINAVTKAIPSLGKIFRKKKDLYLEYLNQQLLEDQENNRGTKGNKSMHDRIPITKYAPIVDEFNDPNLSRHEKISQNKGIQDKTAAILESVEKIKEVFEEDSNYWRRSDFKQIYSMGKGVKRVSGFKSSSDDDPLDTYKYYIDNVVESIGLVRKESVQKPQLFINFDNTRLIDTFLDIGNEHVNEIFRLIVNEARGELESLYNTFDYVSRELNTDTEDLKILKDKQELYNKIMAEKEQLKARIEPIQKKFDYLKGKNQEHQLSEAEHNRLRTVYEAWDNFEKSLIDGKQMLNKIQKKLKQGVDEDVDDFRKVVEDNKKQFQENAPYT